MPILIDEVTRQRVLRERNSGDINYDLISDQPAIQQEDVPLIGNWSDWTTASLGSYANSGLSIAGNNNRLFNSNFPYYFPAGLGYSTPGKVINPSINGSLYQTSAYMATLANSGCDFICGLYDINGNLIQQSNTTHSPYVGSVPINNYPQIDFIFPNPPKIDSGNNYVLIFAGSPLDISHQTQMLYNNSGGNSRYISGTNSQSSFENLPQNVLFYSGVELFSEWAIISGVGWISNSVQQVPTKRQISFPTTNILQGTDAQILDNAKVDVLTIRGNRQETNRQRVIKRNAE